MYINYKIDFIVFSIQPCRIDFPYAIIITKGNTIIGFQETSFLLCLVDMLGLLYPWCSINKKLVSFNTEWLMT